MPVISSIHPPFVLDNDGIADADWLSDRNLHAGNEIGENRPRGETDDDTGGAS